MSASDLARRAAKPALFVLCLGPLLQLVWLALGEGLSANPIEFLNRYLGDWAMRMILVTLVVTPVRLLSGWGGLARFRRMLGLFAFTYAFLHLSSYIVLDHFFDWPRIWDDIVKRNFITVGMIAVLALVPLAVTSTNKMLRRLGSRKWQRLHQLIYPIAILVIVHYYMMVKADIREPLIYGAVLAALLLVRVFYNVKRRRAQKAQA
jgi:sulfoxide reductase heme-binding subunit YedZ